jgi:hypothetical protein
MDTDKENWERIPRTVSRIELVNHSPIQRGAIAKTRKPFLPLLGERAGVRASFLILTLPLGVHGQGAQRRFRKVQCALA